MLNFKDETPPAAVVVLDDIPEGTNLKKIVMTPDEVLVLAKRDKPMKPIRVKTSINGDETDGCPICRYEYYSAYPFCPGCGQRMDWGKEMR